MYFESFPKVYYTNVKGIKPKLVTNLLRRIGVRDAIKTNAVSYTKYLIKNIILYVIIDLIKSD